MDPDTFRGDVGVEGPEVYWRRRVAVLTGALVVVAVVAWACTSATGGSGDKPPGRSGKDPAVRPGAAPPQASASAAPSPASPRPEAGRGAGPKPSPSSPGRPRRPGDPCRRPDLVVSLQGEARVYAGKRTPRFLLTVVNTGRLPCTVDLGPTAVETRITSGADRVWSTADCLSGEREEIKRLRRGVPHVSTVAWDRRRSAPHCGAPRTKARKGTYVAMARLGAAKSHKVVFHLH
ncbi:hypothetical protein [Sphaerisporangium sp. TRM90804]|uniref:hypothetical protein n=1 Tax=Sphaerisporangium sp. TRM90804 TaxID=3031113 RepID=UPI002447346A|nr:hypothetical protein [Sphaerisporangium sp. TRM90804]MDH2429214.1 hypothetical protein [Sphaerisporangium sp. TRM90804]